MKIKEFDLENTLYKCTQFECERTGIKIQRVDMKYKEGIFCFNLIDGEKILNISESMFETLRKLIQ